VTYALTPDGDDVGGPSGYTYAGVMVCLSALADRHASEQPDRPRLTREEVLDALREVRFSGWLGPPEDGWLVAVAAKGDVAIAAGRRDVIGVGAWLAERLAATVFAFRVLADRQLLIGGWSAGQELGRYLSDPSHGRPDGEHILSEPLGVEAAAAFSAACDRPQVADELSDLLSEELDPDSVVESERLATVLRLLGLPQWLVSASSLPRDIPAGPQARNFIRLGAGADGIAGRVRGWAAGTVRKWRRPPAAITDAPRGSPPDIDPWLL
jgi:hypothetical protein